VDNLIIYTAKYLILVPPLIFLYFLWKAKPSDRRRVFIFVIAVGVLSFILAQLTQHLYTNPRPPFKDGAVPLFKPSDYNGFPSDHTLFAAALGFGLLRFSKRWGEIVLALALIVGWARVAAHVHHAVDVAGAILIAAVSYGIISFFFARSNRKPKRTGDAS
jgi:undecaprenyl-diphosphatase